VVEEKKLQLNRKEIRLTTRKLINILKKKKKPLLSICFGVNVVYNACSIDEFPTL